MADLRAKPTSDFDLDVIEAFHEIMPLTLHRQADPMNAFPQLEDPP
jgi:hypothetical protein